MATSARIDELKKKFDDNPRRYFAPLANEYRKAGDPAKAISICEAHLPQQPGHMSGHIVFGQALYEVNRLDEARSVFETALSLDPENLIALRHLGDIARLTGEVAAARSWYERVLEADPRNEEIASLVASLVPPPPPPAPPVVEEPPPPLAAEQRRSDATSTMARRPTPHDAPTIEIDPPTLSITPPPLPPPPSPSADHPLLDLEDFSIGGVPVSASEPEIGEPAAFEPPASSAPTIEIESAADSAIGDAVAFEADPLAIASGRQTVPRMRVFDDVPTLPGDAESPQEPPPLPEAAFETFAFPSADASAPAVEAEPAVPPPLPDWTAIEPVSEEPALELEAAPVDAMADMVAETTPETRAEASADASVSAEFAAMFVQPATPESVPTVIVAAVDVSPPVEEPAPAEAFITETMAELYLQQGHTEAALDIYRKLVEQRPGDTQLEDRLRIIERRVYGPPEVAEPEPAPVAEAPAAALAPQGPSIREFLAGFAARVIGHPMAAEQVMAEGVIADEYREPETSTAVVDQLPVAPPLGQEATTSMDDGGLVPDVVDQMESVTHQSAAVEMADEGYAAGADYGIDTTVPPPPPPEDEFESPPMASFGAVDTTSVEAEAEGYDEPEAYEAYEEPEAPAAYAETVESYESYEAYDQYGAAPVDSVETDEPTELVEAFESAELAEANEVVDEAAAGSIDALFPGAEAPEADDYAAAALAEGFAPPDAPSSAPFFEMPEESAGAQGEAPMAEAAPAPSSDAPPAGASDDGFSFDQFFAGDVEDATPNTPRESQAMPGDAADVAQFNQWLTGLKKT